MPHSGRLTYSSGSRTDYYSEAACSFLADRLTGIAEESFRELLAAPMITFSPGTIILKRGVPSDHLYLIVTGSVESINHVTGAGHHFSAGSLAGELSQSERTSGATYRTISFVHALKIPQELPIVDCLKEVISARNWQNSQNGCNSCAPHGSLRIHYRSKYSSISPNT